MSLRDLDLRHQYRSDSPGETLRERHHLLEDFYIPCLERSLTYDRAVGFFSSTSLAAAAKGIATLIRVGGRMRLIASPYLSQADADAIAQGLKQREEVITAVLVQELEQLDQLAHDRLAYLAWLLSKGRLEIKLAVHRDPYQRGLYHEKLGIFRDVADNVVVFTGSANESVSGLIDNFECVDVFRSWRSGDDERIAEKLDNFQRLWENQTPRLEVLEFPEAARRSLLRHCPGELSVEGLGSRGERGNQGDQGGRGIWGNQRQGGQGAKESGENYSFDALDPSDASAFSVPSTPLIPSHVPTLPLWLTIRSYQRQAIDNWFANRGRGTLKMATGSGKTITALALAAELYQKIGLQVLLVVCPYRHLVTQWARECQKFGLEPILAFENVRTWQSKLSTQLYNVRAGNQPFLTIITTNATLMSQGLQSQLPYLPEKTLIVGDEAHNLGAKRLEASLPRNVGLRLALSATPERYFDDRGTQSLFDYFGSVLEPEFTLRDAIEQGALVPYLYYPLFVELTEQEAQAYSELSTKIGRALAIADGDEQDSAVATLSMQRARLLSTATNKLHVLRELMKPRLQSHHTLFYCGDGSVEDEVSQETQTQLEAVSRLLGKELGYRINIYTADTPLEERETLRQQFEAGELQGLVAIRCLDEGVDIPNVETAVILASSSNPRQFIQRRGRILRRHPNKQRATLFDMIVLPPALDRETLTVERNLLRRELRRVIEFADLADNQGEARAKLLGLQQQYDLLDM
ncbi:MAG: DNA phosphorothioation system restriction enzyme [Lyngbya sp. HA4199-MV5]|nr:DNA phosphorothioation system restriction enzyme [Lyngbya sp. HA4199-MV5]